MKKEKICGIYCIENLINGKKYVGQSQDIFYRWRKHKETLNKNNCNCTILQYAWNKYGKENFTFYIIEKCDIGLLDEKEKFYIKELKSHISENGYNIGWGGEISPMRGRNHTKKTKEKISLSSRGENNGFFGKFHSDEDKEKMSKSRGKESNGHKGIIYSKKRIEKMSNLVQGVKSKKNPSSKYVGVTINKCGNWKSLITKDKKTYYLGTYKTEIEAAINYNKKAIELFGENAKLNIIENGE